MRKRPSSHTHTHTIHTYIHTYIYIVYMRVSGKVHRLTKIISWKVTKWGLFLDIFLIAFYTLLPLVLQCLNLIDQKIINRRYINFSACVCVYIYIYICIMYIIYIFFGRCMLQPSSGGMSNLTLTRVDCSSSTRNIRYLLLISSLKDIELTLWVCHLI